MPFCQKCGASLTPGVKFCTQCGAPVVTPEPAETNVWEAPAAPVVPETPANPWEAPAAPAEPVQNVWEAPAAPAEPVQNAWEAPAAPAEPVQNAWDAPEVPAAPVQGAWEPQQPAQTWNPQPEQPAQTWAPQPDAQYQQPQYQQPVYGQPQYGGYTPPPQPPQPQKKKNKWLAPVLIGVGVIALALVFIFVILPAIGGGSSGGSPELGVYNVQYATYGGYSVEVSDYFPDGFNVELKKGSKAAINMGGVSVEGKYTLVGNRIQIDVAGGAMTFSGTLENGVMTLTNVSGTGVDLILAKPGAMVQAPPTPTPEPAIEVTPDPGPDPTAPPDPTAQPTPEPTPEPTATPGPGPNPPTMLMGDYYGWVSFDYGSGAYADTHVFVDSTAVIAIDSGTQKPFFEGYIDGLDHAAISLYINYNSGTIFTPDIGDQDAWVYNRYLVEDDAVYFNVDATSGLIYIIYPYVDPEDPNSTMIIEFCYRMQGQYWDEANDILPPGYDDYRATLG